MKAKLVERASWLATSLLICIRLMAGGCAASYSPVQASHHLHVLVCHSITYMHAHHLMMLTYKMLKLQQCRPAFMGGCLFVPSWNEVRAIESRRCTLPCLADEVQGQTTLQTACKITLCLAPQSTRDQLCSLHV